jgi:alpha-ribazole phosphatase
MLRAALPEKAVLVSSDLRRAIQTAEKLARKSWQKTEPTKHLREQNFGDWEGKSYDQAGAAIEAFWRDPALSVAPNGESFAQVCDRVGRYVTAASKSGQHEFIAVAHAGAIRAALALALTLPPSMALRFDVAPLSLTRIDWIVDHETWRIGAVNMTF